MSGPYNVKQALLAAYRHLLTPLVRILLRNGISYLEFAEVARQVFVDVAGRDFTLPKRKISLSRIAIMTGLSRKEVARLAREGQHLKRISEVGDLNRVTRVLQGWYTDGDFTGPYGVPLDLPFEEGGRKPSFSELVRRYSGDMPARAMLDELVRVAAARIESDSGFIRVLSRSYIPEKLAPESIRRFATVAHNFIDVLDVNLHKPGPGKGRFERVVHADNGLTVKDLGEFELFVRERAPHFLVEIDDWLSGRTGPAPGSPRTHTGVGLYHYIRDELEERRLDEMLERGEGESDVSQ